MLECVADLVVFEYFIFHGVSQKLCSREVGVLILPWNVGVIEGVG